MKENIRYEKIILKALEYFGEVLAEYGENFNATPEDLISGLWEPDEEIIKDAMYESLNILKIIHHENLEDCEKIVKYWYKKYY